VTSPLISEHVRPATVLMQLQLTGVHPEGATHE
jgi:hypothetical protein